MALSNPIGSATSIAMLDTRTVPATSGRTPKLGVANRGVHSVPNRKSVSGTSRRKANVSTARTTIMPAVVPMESRAQRSSAHSMTRSNRFIPRLARVAPDRARDDPEPVEGSSLLGEERFERHAHLRAALAERSAGPPVGEVLAGQLVDLRREFDVSDLLDQVGAAEEHFHELLDLGAVGRL